MSNSEFVAKLQPVACALLALCDSLDGADGGEKGVRLVEVKANLAGRQAHAGSPNGHRFAQHEQHIGRGGLHQVAILGGGRRARSGDIPPRQEPRLRDGVQGDRRMRAQADIKVEFLAGQDDRTATEAMIVRREPGKSDRAETHQTP